MISRLIELSFPWGALAAAILVFGYFPGLVLSLVMKVYHRDDPRRAELQAELYAVPRWERPFWVAEQFELATREAAFPFASWWFGRLVWHRASLKSGVESNREHPDTFEIPTQEDRDSLQPGDRAKLMWQVRGWPGERMWVQIQSRRGDRCVGRLINDPMFVHLHYGAKVSFHMDHIIDWQGPIEEDDGTNDEPCIDKGAA